MRVVPRLPRSPNANLLTLRRVNFLDRAIRRSRALPFRGTAKPHQVQSFEFVAGPEICSSNLALIFIKLIFLLHFHPAIVMTRTVI